MSHPRPRPPRIASVHVLGAPPKRPDKNEGRARLLNWIVEKIDFEADWGSFDALLLPAGFFRLEAALGPLDSQGRARAVDGSAIAFDCRKAAERLAQTCGALLVIGIDTRRYMRGFSGDNIMVAWLGDRVVGSARKVFPPAQATALTRRRPCVTFAADADDPARIVDLPSGGRALLLICYDAFLFSEIARGPTARRASMRYLADGKDGGRASSSSERDDLVERFAALVEDRKPAVALIAIHRFKKPGRDTFWQRHGIAGASAGLGGGLAVGAAHYRSWLPDPDNLGQSTLASAGVNPGHLFDGLHRKARKLAANDAFFAEVPGSPGLCALVRLFEGRTGG
jgi:hypothetical protein